VSAPLGWGAAWRIARRDLRFGLRGLRLLFLCLFLGITMLAGIGSLTSAITGEMALRGQRILGGDLEASIHHREATDAELGRIAEDGRLSRTIRMRAMARRADGARRQAGPETALSELKGVDAAYPLYGTVLLQSGAYKPLSPDEVVIDPGLADRLDVRVGDRLGYGQADFTIAGIIADEPDRLGEGFTLGPVALVSMEGLRRTGLIQPGSLYEARYRVQLPAGVNPEIRAEKLGEEFRSAGFSFKHRDRAAPGAERFFERMGQFLSLIGLAALVIAGIGVRNGVASYLAARRGSIATLKVLGARSGDIARIYGLQLGAIALAATVSGLVAGALLPPLLVQLAGDVLPVRPGFAIHPEPLAASVAYGLLTAFMFSLPPLAQARTEPAAALFRGIVEKAGGTTRRTRAGVVVAAMLLFAVAMLTAREPMLSAGVLGGISLMLLVLLLLGRLVVRLSARLPRSRRPLLRLALANLHRPGAPTTALVVALGLALTLFVSLAGIQTSLTSEMQRTVPQKAPDLFMLDIPADAEARFRSIVATDAPTAEINIVPALRGTITAYGGTRVEDLEELPDGAWFLRGERGVTYSRTLPEGSDLVEGDWWPADYDGPPLVSVDVEAARKLGVGIGDPLTVAVLGREIEARIASLRRVNWDTMGFNYIMVFSPNTLAAAPHSLAATITGAGQAQAGLTRTLLAAFPASSIISVGDVIIQAREILGQMSAAILVAASVAVLAGIAVLAGAIAAAREARIYDSVILKTLGATRLQILGSQMLEYGALALLLAIVALGIGTAAAYGIVVHLFEFGWAPDWGVMFGVLAGGALLTLGMGMAGSLPLLSIRPARALRQL